jgi:hypothetical protein
VAQDYASFVHIRPFYEFSFAHALRGLWKDVPFSRTHLVRSTERRIWLSVDYGIESVYCELIELATHATYGYEDVNTAAWIQFPSVEKAQLGDMASLVKLVKDLGPTEAIVEVPRYQEFTDAAQSLVGHGVAFRQIAGNELIVMSAIAPRGWTADESKVQPLLVQPILTAPGEVRAVLLCRVSSLGDVIVSLQSQGVRLEHLYDY